MTAELVLVVPWNSVTVESWGLQLSLWELLYWTSVRSWWLSFKSESECLEVEAASFLRLRFSSVFFRSSSHRGQNQGEETWPHPQWEDCQRILETCFISSMERWCEEGTEVWSVGGTVELGRSLAVREKGLIQLFRKQVKTTGYDKPGQV